MQEVSSLIPEVDPLQEKTAFTGFMERVATAEERAVLWPKANALYSGYDGYQERAGDREIPVVICSPRG